MARGGHPWPLLTMETTKKPKVTRINHKRPYGRGHMAENRDSLPPISYGKLETMIVTSMQTHPDVRFSARAFSIRHNVSRSSIRHALERLCKKQIIEKKLLGVYALLPHARDTENPLATPGQMPRRVWPGGWPGDENLSQHQTRYEIPIKDCKKFHPDKLKLLSPLDIRHNKLPNYTQHYAYFDDATLVVNTRKVIIYIHDIEGAHTEETMQKAFDKALSYFQLLEKIGIDADQMMLAKADWARFETILADLFERIQERFCITLRNGKKLWVDYSGGKRELESDDPQVLDRLYEYMESALNAKTLPTDLDKACEMLNLIVKLLGVQVLAQRSSNFNTPPEKRGEVPGYIQ